MKQTWIFYSYNSAEPQTQIYEGEMTCIKPNRTKLWKTLQSKLHSYKDVNQIGYKLKN